MKVSPLALSAVMAVATTPLFAQNSIEDAINAAREQVKDDLRNSNIGAGYAQMLNFFVDPSISASRLDADSEDGTRYDVYKLPLQYAFPANDGEWQLVVRGTLSHASAENKFSLIEGEVIDGTWEADSALIGVGALVPAGENLSWFVGGQFGISRLENEADYRGELSEFLAPILDGILFNWDTNARISSLTGGLDYHTRFADQYEVTLNGRYTYSHIASYSESRDLQSFSEDTGTLAASADIEHPWGTSLGDVPLFGVARLGATAFTGPSRKALGFSHFYSIGYSVGLDVAERSRYFEDFTLGAQYNFGKDVDGFSLVFGWQLK